MLSACSFLLLTLSLALHIDGEISVGSVVPQGRIRDNDDRWVTAILLSLIEGKCKCQRCLKKKGLVVSHATWNKL